MRHKFIVPSLIKQFIVRFIIALLCIGALAVWLSWWPTHQLRGQATKAANQLEQARQSLQASRKSLAKIDDPTNIAKGKPPTGKQYAADIARVETEIQKVTISPPKTLHYSPTFGSTNKLLGAINALIASPQTVTAYKNADQASASLHSLLTYHSDVMKTVANILDYDPAVDFKKFDLASKDSQTRLNKAKTGLDKTLKGLGTSISPKLDPAGQDLINSVRDLQTERGKLAVNGDLVNWQAAVKKAQNDIQANRSIFWNQEKSALIKQLIILDQILTDTVQKWIKVTALD